MMVNFAPPRCVMARKKDLIASYQNDDLPFEIFYIQIHKTHATFYS